LEVLAAMDFAWQSRSGWRVKRKRHRWKSLPDLVAGALARRDIDAAIGLLEEERDRGSLVSTTHSCLRIFTA